MNLDDQLNYNIRKYILKHFNGNKGADNYFEFQIKTFLDNLLPH